MAVNKYIYSISDLDAHRFGSPESGSALGIFGFGPS
jgi:hypothetical protein